MPVTNRDYLPGMADPTGSANALWDLPRPVSDTLSGGTTNFYRGIFYCPGSVLLSSQNQDYWWFYTGTGSSDHRVTAYQWITSRDGIAGRYGGASPPPGAATGVALSAPKGYLNKITTPYTNTYTVANTEMVTDVMISSGTFTAGMSGANPRLVRHSQAWFPPIRQNCPVDTVLII